MGTSKIGFELQDNLEPNVEGYFNPHKVCQVWNFTEKALNATGDYTLFIDTDSTVAIGAGGAVFTTLATDDRVGSIACGGLFLRPADYPVAEFRFSINNITTVAMWAGLHDATAETAGLLPTAIATATPVYTATDCAGFMFDTDQSAAYWNIANVNNNSGSFTQLAATYVPVNNVKVTLRVVIDATGAASYYYNGALVGTKAAAVATGALLNPYFGICNRTTAARIATLRRVSLWSDQ